MKLLAGALAPAHTPWQPFDPLILDFLAALSDTIRAAGAREMEELAAFGFWCRRTHLESLARRHAAERSRLGRGLLLHIAPSNVPTVFAYSLAIGLLAGNTNLIRLSMHRGPAEECLCGLLCKTLEQPTFEAVRERIGLISYPRNDALTTALLANCDGRVVWGGDATVAAIRALPMPAHAVEVCFPNRWSLALLSQAALSRMDCEARAALAHRFYNDTYLMDQNACSSPHAVFWLEDGGNAAVRTAWWQAVAEEVARRCVISPYKAVQKYELACTAAMMNAGVSNLKWYGGNRVCVAGLTEPPTPDALPFGRFGLFFECGITSLEQLLPLLCPKVQTISCAGLATEELAAFLVQHHSRGGDRVVPVGQALEMDTVWDGTDLISALSRTIG